MKSLLFIIFSLSISEFCPQHFYLLMILGFVFYTMSEIAEDNDWGFE